MANTPDRQSQFRRAEFPGDPVSYLIPTYDQMAGLAYSITHQMRQAGVHPENVISVSDGAHPYGLMITDNLALSKDRKTITMAAKAFAGVSALSRVEITQGLSRPIRGQSAVLVDEVVDRGDTMQATADFVRTVGGPSELWTVGFIHKAHSTFEPDFVGARIASEWVVFPHDRRESIESITTRWVTKLHTPESLVLPQMYDLYRPEPGSLEEAQIADYVTTKLHQLNSQSQVWPESLAQKGV